MERALMCNILITPLLMIDLTYSIYVTFTALSIGLVCVIYKLQFNSHHLFFEDIMLKYFSSLACEICSFYSGCTVLNATRPLYIPHSCLRRVCVGILYYSRN